MKEIYLIFKQISKVQVNKYIFFFKNNKFKINFLKTIIKKKFKLLMSLEYLDVNYKFKVNFLKFLQKVFYY